MSLGEVLGEVIRDSTLEAEVRGCRIALNVSFTGEILGNRELLRRAIENVIRNGIRYSPGQSTIDVFLVGDSTLRRSQFVTTDPVVS